MGEKGRNKRIWLVAAVLALVLVGDMAVFLWATDRPLGLQPAEFTDGPKLAIGGQARPAAGNPSPGMNSGEIVPALTWEVVVSEGSPKYDVLAFGRRKGALYLKVRLYESMDFSQRKGWGRMFALLDDRGVEYLFSSRRLPNAVNVYDMLLTELPDDLYCRQTVLEGGHRDLYLVFPQFPVSRLPFRLSVIEEFEGGSPVNPGIVFEEERITATGERWPGEAILAMGPGEWIREGRAVEVPGLSGTSVRVVKVAVDLSHLVHISLEVCAGESVELKVLDAVLVGPDGHNYNRLELEREPVVRVTADDPSELVLVFEKLPAGLELPACSLWLRLAAEDGTPLAVTLGL
ncbi:MAG TPA: hypothetical protein DEA73_07185 [Peptococcaceae bacterium]|nr:MAG: hypothetical protein XD51_0789 [Moorella sp. 60_41]HBT47642.1 hypothetical protein [Peptococcaceae bacterium]